MDDYRFTTGDVEESLSIMREAAEWLIDIGEPMWTPDELTRDMLKNPAEEFTVMYDSGGNSVATMILSYHDPFFWADVPPDVSGFIHKLAVRRSYAGTGAAKKLVEYAVSVCERRGVGSIRLDCDPHRIGLCRFYEKCGFVLEETKTINTRRLGVIDVAMYKLDILKIRRATLDDVSLLIKLRIDYLTDSRGVLSEDETKAVTAQLKYYFEKYIPSGDFIGVIAEINGCAVSNAFLAISEKPANPSFITGKIGTLLNVHTYPEYRRKGYATKVISEIISEAKKMNLSFIELSASSDGKPLYEKLGFSVSNSGYTSMKLKLI